MQLQCRAIDYYSLILVGHGPTLFIFGGAMAYTAYTVPTPMTEVVYENKGDPNKNISSAKILTTCLGHRNIR